MASIKISDIEGIGPTIEKKLNKAGVKSVNGLLKTAASAKGRKELAKVTGFETKTILSWVNMADLYRVKGVGSEYSELLHAAGVDTVKELRKRKPENLVKKMEEVNSAKKKRLVRAVPTLKRVQSWVEHAKTLDPIVTH
ncbi:DNA repair and recombination protein RadA [bacterium BMS3Abin04]|nr:DNA repair and recombination protein RadA [bacterium BMS3Abin04]